MAHLASEFRSSKHLPLLVRALWGGACLLALGCEPELGSDASLSDAGDAAPSWGGDAAPPVPFDASAVDSAVAQDGSAARDDGALADAGAPDAGGALDAGAYDASAELDGRAPVDAGPLDAETRNDGALADAGLTDAGLTDAGLTDAGLTDAGLTDAGQAQYERSGEVVWPVRQAERTEYCPQQSIAVWKNETITLHDPSARGFDCYLSCSESLSSNPNEAIFLLNNGEIELFLYFRDRVRLGYSTQSFRENLLRADLRWWSAPKTVITSADMWRNRMYLGTVEQPTVEVVSYQAPLLHVRVRGRSIRQDNFFRAQATTPHFCIGQGKFGPVSTICTDVDCAYATNNLENATNVTVDLQVPIRM